MVLSALMKADAWDVGTVNWHVRITPGKSFMKKWSLWFLPSEVRGGVRNLPDRLGSASNAPFAKRRLMTEWLVNLSPVFTQTPHPTAFYLAADQRFILETLTTRKAMYTN
jgi:hypothetical protein